jgi:uncharacterized protein YfaS (alpha-2-macroglobulin family)
MDMRRLLFLTVALAGCPGTKPQGADGRPPATSPRAPEGGLNMIASDTPGLSFKLHEGVEAGKAQPRAPAIKAAPLDDATVQKILARLAPMKTTGDEEKPFALRERSLPAPRPGQTVKGEFPPREAAPAPDPAEAGPLRVLRHQPDGEVPIAPHVSVTFSQPMVAVTSYAELEKLAAPVKLTPQPPGRWRWVGAKTVLFEAAGAERLPMATVYSVEVPAGTKSATGGALAKAETWSFATPPVKVESFYPQDGPTTREPLIFAAFDQAIEPAAVLASITGAKLRLATSDEVKADPTVSEMVAALEADGKRDRYLVARPIAPLPVDTSVTIAIGPGTPSAEGPRKTEEKQAFSFHTYGAMRVTDQSCKSAADECGPFAPFWIQMSNPVDTKKFKKEMVSVEPAIPAMKVTARGESISITGATKGRSTYRVTLSGALPDTFGQTMGQDANLTFVTGPADKALFTTGGEFVVLDPTAAARYSVFSINYSSFKVKLFAASPSDWERFLKYAREEFHREAYPADPPLKLISSETVSVKGEPDELTETRIDLSKALTDGAGSVVIFVEPPTRPKNRWEWRPSLVWAQVTPIGLDAMLDHEELIGWATNLADGKPLDGVELAIEPAGIKGTTDKSGTVRLPLGDKPGKMLVARQGNKVAFLPENTHFYNDNATWARNERGDFLRWYVADDRHMYKPGEEVRLKGWLRRIGGGEAGDVMGLDGAVSRVDWTLRDSRGNDITKGTTQVNALGGFDLAIKLPPTMNLGSAQVNFEATDSKLGRSDLAHSFEVQEFRRPEYEVSNEPSDGPYFVGGRATVTVSAKYYAGGALANAETRWDVHTTPGSFSPPNRDEWVFGRQPSWWDNYGVSRGRGRSFPGRGGGEGQTLEAHTDNGGKHVLGIDFLGVNPPQATNLVAQATVMDVNRQALSASSNLLVHPAAVYVGMKTARSYVQKGETLKIDLLVVDLDGKVVTGRKVAVRSARMDWEWTDEGIETSEADVKTCEVSSGDSAQQCRFDHAEGGLYRVTATVTDDQGRENQSQLSIWMAGGKLPPQRGVQVEEARLLPDKKQYRGGETAEVLVVPPFYPAEGVMTLRRSGIFRVERFTVTGASHTLKIKIEEGWTPNVFVQVDLVGAAPRTDDSGNVDDRLPRRPAVASGQVSLSIPPLSRELKLSVEPRVAALEPGGQTSVAVGLRDAEGQPVEGGEVAVVIVDEAVLSLSNYQLPDPLAVFYSPRDDGGRDYHLRVNLLLAKPDELAGAAGGAAEGTMGRRAMMKSGAMAPGGMPPPSPSAAPQPMMLAEADMIVGNGGGDAAIKVRTDFNALALFAPTVRTDAKGRAEVAVKLPDNLTRYRVMAIAVSGPRQFGAGEATITARLPLMVRPSAPRFLNFGDRFELPVVLQNQTDQPMEVSLAARTANLELTAGAGRRVTVPANDRVEVRLPAAANQAGIARFQLGAVAGSWSDAAEVELPVWTPATTEAFATYGVVDEPGPRGAVAQPVKMPEGVFPQFGGVEVTTSSTALQALSDAVLYLVRYPFECSEQMASRVLAVAALRDVLAAFDAQGLPKPEVIVASVKKDVEMLQRLQNPDGGWSFWRRGDESWAFLTLHVAHALGRAKDKGFEVPAVTIERAKPYLRDIESHIPSFYPVDVRRSIVAYSLYVRNRLGDRDTAKARRLIAEAGSVEKLPFEAVAWIYPVLTGDAGSTAELAAIRKLVDNKVEETAAAAHFVTGYADGSYLLLHSDRRVDALFLEALIGDQPKNDVIPKLVEGLLGHRKAGHWENTQESAWVLLALDRYFETYEKVTPDFVARVWLGDQYAGEHAFKGRTTERHGIDIPMSWLAEKGNQVSQLVLMKDDPGKGRLYYRIGMSYAPTDLRMPPRDNGFTVTREYEAVDDKADVRREQDGTWRVKAGARVRVRVTMVAPARRTHVALVDPLPAGLEILNPALAVTGEIPKDPKDPRGGGRWWWGPWYEHQNLRDERAEAFASLVWDGVHTYSYVARATTPGTFVVPPPKAEEMYHPETFGRGAGDRLVVE